MMSETYLELNEDEDFKLTAHVDSDGNQRVIATGYIIRRRNGAVYRAPLIPELFFGANGQQLQTWSQYLTAGDHVVLRRDSGNPHVPDSELYWQKVSEPPQRQPPAQTTVQTYEIPIIPILVLMSIPFGLYLLYRLTGKATKK